MARVRVGAGHLYYEIRGSAGPPVLYLLGLGSFTVPPSPYRLEDVLAGGARVLIPDARGLARSDPDPTGTYSIDGFARDAAALLDHAGWPRVHVVGVSMGGMVAQAFARRYPQRTLTLGLLATAAGIARGVPPDDATLAILENRDRLPAGEATRRGWTRSYTTAFIEAHGPYLEWRRGEQACYATDPAVHRYHLAALRAFDSEAWLDEIACPTLVVWGEADRIIPPANSRRLAARLPHAATVALPGLGHAFPTEARADVAAALRGLWAQRPLAGAAGERA